MTTPRHVTVGELTLGNDLPMVLIAGPCAMESRAHALETAAALKEMAHKLVPNIDPKALFPESF